MSIKSKAEALHLAIENCDKTGDFMRHHTTRDLLFAARELLEAIDGARVGEVDWVLRHKTGVLYFDENELSNSDESGSGA